MIEMKAITLNFFTFGGVSNPATVNGFHISHSSQSFIHPQGMQTFLGHQDYQPMVARLVEFALPGLLKRCFLIIIF